jgi:hypothetical protein
MKLNIAATIVALALAVCVGCSSSPSANTGPNPPQNVYGGAWEFILGAPSTGAAPLPPNLYVDVNLTQTGTTVSGTGYAFALLSASTPVSVLSLGSATVTGTVNKNNATLQLQFDGATYAATTSVDPSAGTLNGTFDLNSGAAVTVAGYGAATLGTATGGGTAMIFANDGGILPMGSLTMAVTEEPNFSVTGTGIGVSLAGTASGNAVTLKGTVDSATESWLAYYDATGVTGTAGTIWIFDSASGALLGELGPQ